MEQWGVHERRECVREGVTRKGGELEEGAEWLQRNTGRVPRTKAGTEPRGTNKNRKKEKQGSIRSTVQKDGNGTMETEITVRQLPCKRQQQWAKSSIFIISLPAKNVLQKQCPGLGLEVIFTVQHSQSFLFCLEFLFVLYEKSWSRIGKSDNF